MKKTKYLTPEEAAKKLGITERTLSNWRTVKQGPKWIKIGSKTVYDSEVVSAYVSKQQTNAYWMNKTPIALNWKAPEKANTMC